MKIYLDTCVYNRPFDDQTQERISLETYAFLTVLERIEKKVYDLVISEVNIFENERDKKLERKIKVKTIFKLANEFVELKETELKKVEYLEKLGFSGLDALHIVAAEKAKAEYLITCDDKMIKVYKNNEKAINVKVLNILEFVLEEVI
jgi:predicted nucleic acid-binding protein